MLDTDKTHIRHLAEICFRKGVTRFVISPGSRSTPLIIALSRRVGMELIPIVDERSAAFFALGMAQQTGNPVGLVCTSGSAALNYAPAIAEAYYQKIPFIVFTADRPKEWIDQQDGQTIRQQDIYHNYIVKSFELPVEAHSKEDLWLSDRIVNEAINTAMLQQGPVHVNVPLREPLNRQVDVHHEEEPKIIIASPQPSPKERDFSFVNDDFEKVMILGGNGSFNLPPDSYRDFQSSNFTIHSEITCNLNIPSHKNLDALIHSIPQGEEEKYRPDLLITFGGAIVSKKLKEFLRKHSPRQHWHLSEQLEHTDTFQCLTHVLPISIESVMERLQNEKIGNSAYPKLWNELSEKVKSKQEQFISKAPYSDFKVYHSIFQHLNLPLNLHLGNSTPVRYAAYFEIPPHIQVNSNRGVSGIDGTVSTAAGAAYVNEKLTVLITGDLAFMYDSNGLWNPKLPANLRVIVINNQGGNIFRLINDEKNLPELNEYFETPHQYSIEHVCKCVNVPYYFCDSENGLKESLKTFFEPNNKPAVLEIKTDGKLGAEVFKDFITTLKS